MMRPTAIALREERMTRFRSFFTYANVMATIAVFLALGGVSYAAFTLPKNSVGSRQIKRGAVNSAKITREAVGGGNIKRGAVGGDKIKLGTIPPAAIQGGALTKDQSRTIVVSQTISKALVKDSFVTGKVMCPDGYQALSGGVDPKNVFQAKVSVSAPLIEGVEPQLKPDGQYGPASGWYGAVTTQGATGSTPGVVLQVVCAPLG
jgi:hypothetical protein